MAFIRPSLVLQAMLVPEEYSIDEEKEIKRSYMHIAQSVVRPWDADKAGEGNVMQFRIRLMKPYWDEADPAAAELWDAVMPLWIRNQAKNVSTAMHNFNTVDHPGAAKNISYEWTDFEFNDNATIRVKTEADNTIGADMPALAAKVRHLLCSGALGERKPALIRVPSRESIADQLAAYGALRAQARDANKAREAALAAAEAAAAAAEAGEISPEEAEAAKAAVPAAVTVPPFAYDYSVWGLEYADGSVVQFDSRNA